MKTIDPDDTELKNAIHDVEERKKLYERADKIYRRSNPNSLTHADERKKWDNARNFYESALINLALIVMERL